MKRAMSVLALLICLVLAVPAFAEPVLINADIGDVDIVYGTCYLEIPGMEGYGLADINGNMITDMLYGGFSNEFGYITSYRMDLEGRNVFGMFGADGSILIPFEYGHIEVLNNKWAVAYVLEAGTADQYDMSTYSDEYFLITRVDIYHLPEGAKLAELGRDEFIEAEKAGNGINIHDRTTGMITTYDESFTALGTVNSIYSDELAPADYYKFYENGQYGIKDAAGNVIMPPSYQYVDLYSTQYGDYSIVSDGDKYGLIRISTGEVLLPVEYGYVRNMYNIPNAEYYDTDYEAFGYYCIENDDKIGYATAGGVITCAPKYSENSVSVNGISMMLTDAEGNKIIVAADGVETNVSGYESIYALEYCAGVYYRVSDADYNYGIIDWHGNVVFPCEYDGVDVTSDGQYIIINKDYDTYSLYRLTYFGEDTQSAATQQPAAEEQPAAAENTGLQIGGGIGKVVEETTEETTGENTGLQIGGGIGKVVEETTEETAGENAGLQIGGGISGNIGGAAEAPADQSASEEITEEIVEEVMAPSEGGFDYTMTKNLLSGVVTLLNTDAAANGAAAIAVIESAAAQLSSRNDVTSLLSSAAMLLKTDAAANGAAAATIISTALTLLQ